jgi:hypothetical protein
MPEGKLGAFIARNQVVEGNAEYLDNYFGSHGELASE